MDSQDRTSLLVNNKICTVHSGLQSLSLTWQHLSSMVAPIFHIRLMDCYILHMKVSKVVEAFQDLISLLCSRRQSKLLKNVGEKLMVANAKRGLSTTACRWRTDQASPCHSQSASRSTSFSPHRSSPQHTTTTFRIKH